ESLTGQVIDKAMTNQEKRGYTTIMEGDEMDILQQGKPDFIAFNYYTSQTVGESTGGEADYSHTGDQHETIGEPGAYRGSVNGNLRKTEFGWEIDPVGFRTILREIYSR